jgi:hypothetical protein
MLSDQDSARSYAALESVRVRGQFLIAALLWACAGGLLISLSGYLILICHYGLSLAERLRAGMGWHPPAAGPDYFIIGFI